MSADPTNNPFIELDPKQMPRYQLKLSLVLYLDYAPGPNRARRVYDSYVNAFGDHIRVYQSTKWLGPPFRWDHTARAQFESVQLPALRSGVDWGYAFTDGNRIDHHLFMFHGYRPKTEPGRASFYRFEWPWNFNTDLIQKFAFEIAGAVPFLSGTAGFIINARPFDEDAQDRMFAICRRYWGVEAWGLDTTVNHVLCGYKCPSWLTLIGDRLLSQQADPPALETLDTAVARAEHGYVLQSRPRPELIDRNRREGFEAEAEIANVLSNLQIEEHEPFGGTRWDAENTMAWLRRFSRPDDALD